ncbi:hypothetical protein ACQ4N7_29215 [Nodosilinea sp. AN01ver1]|uniref:hypothetical protein n=1 Tax=Nodosilinea sp. AN01ver1 TaxID=3423362 RepID=UPI003D3155D5
MPNDAESLFNRIDAMQPGGEPQGKEPRRVKGGKRGGKRSRDDYTQIGAYIPVETHKQVKARLYAEDKQLSELLTELLEKWLSE